ncbi:acyltransferase [Rummeliibacillus sp. SL167]|uniref:acyltransferase n=1 Tax=Rummeliibacillus sp. SL167 TaxID=2579792 RepID=UPI0011B56FC6|nr:acyltransferase [Rummeliibacillus sp. SL167]
MDKERGRRFALPLAAVVAVSSMMLLNANYTSVTMTNRILIAAGATIVTYILAFILFGMEDKIK